MNKKTLTFLLVITLLATSFTFSRLAIGGMDEESNWRVKVMSEMADVLEKSYIYEEDGIRLAKFLRGNPDAYNHIQDKTVFAEKLTQDLWKVVDDKHLRLNFVAPAAPIEDSGNKAKQSHSRTATIEHRMVADGVGYIRIPRFFGDEDYMSRFDAAMTEFAEVKALILDLRGNGGGGPEVFNRIISYFFDTETVLLATQSRGEQIKYTRALSAVPGPRYLHRPLYVLVDRQTFSAAESFAFAMSNVTGRARVVGANTGGGGHYGNMVRIDNEFSLFVPVGRAFNPETGKGFQGTGVVPDIQVPPENALQAALEDLNRRMKRDNPL